VFSRNGTIMGNANGCIETIIMLIATLMTGFLSYFSASTPTDTTISEQTSYPFVLTEEGVEYSFWETLNCQYVIAGNIEFLDENTVVPESIVIMIQPLGTYDDRPATIRGHGWDTQFGENGWSVLLVGNYRNLVWLHDSAQDVPLSAEIMVDNLNCNEERILALVNFQQVLPLEQVAD
jgi:hypothetical protein